MKQEDNEPLIEFTKRFNNAMDIMETQHGPLAMNAYLRTREDYQSATDQAAKDAVLNSEYNKLKAFMYLKALDTKKSGKLVEDLGNQFALGNNQFPTSVTKATETVMAYRNRVNAIQSTTHKNYRNNNNGNNSNKQQQSNDINANVAFAQKGSGSARDPKAKMKDLNWKKNIICYNCGEKGHYSNECPKRSVKQSHMQWSNDQEKDEEQHVHAFQNFVVTAKEGVQFQQYEEPSEMKNWILLDTGSSTDIFCDRQLLKDVKHQPVGLTLHTNGGTLKSNQAGELDQYGRVWHEERALTNIFSFYNLQKKFHVTFDNRKDDSFHVFTADQKEILFSPSQTGIY